MNDARTNWEKPVVVVVSGISSAGAAEREDGRLKWLSLQTKTKDPPRIVVVVGSAFAAAVGL